MKRKRGNKTEALRKFLEITAEHGMRLELQTNNFDVSFSFIFAFCDAEWLLYFTLKESGRASFMGISCSNWSGPVKGGILMGYTAKLSKFMPLHCNSCRSASRNIQFLQTFGKIFISEILIWSIFFLLQYSFYPWKMSCESDHIESRVHLQFHWTCILEEARPMYASSEIYARV